MLSQYQREIETLQRHRNGFTFAGHHSSEFGLTVERFPRQQTPAARLTEIRVPGRNGVLHINDGTFENVRQTYQCYIHRGISLPAAAHEINAWLLGGSGYRDLTDRYDHNRIRRAMFAGPMDIENVLNRFGRCKIVFDCLPQVYSPESFQTQEYTNPTEICTSNFHAKPLITVYGTGAGTITVGTVRVQIKNIDGEMMLDSETQNAYKMQQGTMVNKNRDIVAPEFPTLRGTTKISWSGGVTKIAIQTREWCL